MDADTVKACLFAAEDERGKVRQGLTNRHSESDSNTRRLATFLFGSDPVRPTNLFFPNLQQ
jgi:hypothetical protein